MPPDANRRDEKPAAAAAARLRAWFPFLLAYALLAAFFLSSAILQLRRYPVEPAAAASIWCCLVLLVGFFLAPGFSAPREWLVRRAGSPASAAVTLVLFVLPYLIYAAGAGDFHWRALGKLVMLASVPFGLFAVLPVRRPRRLNWQDVIVMLWLALPVLFGGLGGIWNVPINLDFMARLYMVGVGAWSFLLWRRVGDAGYEFLWTPAIVRAALVNFAWFAAVAIPAGLALGFTAWNPRWKGPWAFLFDLVTIFLFIAIPEEFLFRGLLQNLLEGSWGSRYGAQAVASILFGFTHILHHPFPNWRYVILASVAGWFYGSAYRGTRSLMASATTHSLVDTIWRTWFTRVAL